MTLLLTLLVLAQDAPITAANAGQLKQTALLEGNKAPVFGLGWSPDGKWLATAGIDKTARVWDAAGGREIFKVEHKAQVIAVAFSPDGGTLVSAGYDYTVRLWDAKTGKPGEVQSENPKKKGERPQVSTVFVEFSPDAGQLVSCSDGGSFLYFWDVKAKAQSEMQASPTGGGPLFGRMAWSGNGLWLACSIADPKAMTSEIRLWSAKDNKVTATLKGPDKSLVSGEGIAMSADGSKVASVDLNTSVILVWDVKSGKVVSTMKGHKHDADNQLTISQLSFTPDASLLASVSYDKTTRVWEVATGKELLSIPSAKSGGAAVAFSRDGKRLAAADLGGAVQIFGVK